MRISFPSWALRYTVALANYVGKIPDGVSFSQAWVTLALLEQPLSFDAWAAPWVGCPPVSSDLVSVLCRLLLFFAPVLPRTRPTTAFFTPFPRSFTSVLPENHLHHFSKHCGEVQRVACVFAALTSIQSRFVGCSKCTPASTLDHRR